MKFIPALALLAGVAFVSACAQSGPRVGTTQHISCDSFLNAQSALAAELAEFQSPPRCEKKFGPQGGYYEGFGVAGTADRNAADGMRTIIIIFRYYNWDEKLAPISGEDIPDSKNFTVLPDLIPVQLAGVDGDARVAHFDSTLVPVTFVCVTSHTINANGSRSLVDFCRPAATKLDDAGVRALADKIANEDLPGIRP